LGRKSAGGGNNRGGGGKGSWACSKRALKKNGSRKKNPGVLQEGKRASWGKNNGKTKEDRDSNKEVEIKLPTLKKIVYWEKGEKGNRASDSPATDPEKTGNATIGSL